MKKNPKVVMSIAAGIVVVALGFVTMHSGRETVLENQPSAFINQPYPVTVETYNSKNKLEKETFSHVPQRVITIWQGPLETILALGAGDTIIAATGIPDEKYLRPDLRQAYEKIPQKSFSTLKVESALALRPDFIVTSWGSSLTKKNIGSTDFWQSRGVNTYIQEIPPVNGGQRTLDEEYKFILDMGKIFDAQDKAQAMVDEMEGYIAEVVEKTKKTSSRPRVMVLQYMGNKIMNWGDDYLQADMVRRLNGEMIIHTKGFVSEEEILASNPEVVFLMVNEWDYDHMEEVKQKFLDTPSLNSLSCIQNRRIYLFPLYEGQYSAVRTMEGIRTVAEGMYPDIVNSDNKSI